MQPFRKKKDDAIHCFISSAFRTLPLKQYLNPAIKKFKRLHSQCFILASTSQLATPAFQSTGENYLFFCLGILINFLLQILLTPRASFSHLKINHNPGTRTEQTCQFCHKWFTDKYVCKTHEKTIHQKKGLLGQSVDKPRGYSGEWSP